jgi:hypothetical protein
MQNKFRKYGVNKIVYSFLIAIYSLPGYTVPGIVRGETGIDYKSLKNMHPDIFILCR